MHSVCEKERVRVRVRTEGGGHVNIQKVQFERACMHAFNPSLSKSTDSDSLPTVCTEW